MELNAFISRLESTTSGCDFYGMIWVVKSSRNFLPPHGYQTNAIVNKAFLFVSVILQTP